MGDAWRLAVGTFTAFRTGPPRHVDERVLGGAMLLAPVTAGPAALVWVALGLLVTAGLVPPLVAAVLAVSTTSLVSRALHLDGLADLADGLTSGHDPSRSLEVMRRGDTGPAGAAAILLVLLLDVACLASLLGTPTGGALAVAALVASRLACAVCTRDGIPPARADGLGQGVAGTVARSRVAGVVTAVAALAGVAGALVGRPAFAAALAFVGVVGAAVGAAVVVRRHAVRRLGGVTGDVIGAAIEISLAAALTVASVAHAALLP
jgi:adenosylcobinamide-GDP ribazoletransferase